MNQNAAGTSNQSDLVQQAVALLILEFTEMFERDNQARAKSVASPNMLRFKAQLLREQADLLDPPSVFHLDAIEPKHDPLDVCRRLVQQWESNECVFVGCVEDARAAIAEAESFQTDIRANLADARMQTSPPSRADRPTTVQSSRNTLENGASHAGPVAATERPEGDEPVDRPDRPAPGEAAADK